MTPRHNQGESHSLIGSLPKFPVSIGGFQGVQGCFSDKLIVGKSPHLCRKKTLFNFNTAIFKNKMTFKSLNS